MRYFWIILCTLFVAGAAPGLSAPKTAGMSGGIIAALLVVIAYHIVQIRADKRARTQRQTANATADASAAVQLEQIQNGTLPIVTAPQVLTRGDEIVRFEISSTMIEWVKTRATLRAANARVRITDNISIGGTRGSIAANEEPTITGTGVLSITSKRLVFSGIPKSYEIPLAKITLLEALDDGIAINASGKLRLFQLPGASSSAVVEALIRAAR